MKEYYQLQGSRRYVRPEDKHWYVIESSTSFRDIKSSKAYYEMDPEQKTDYRIVLVREEVIQ